MNRFKPLVYPILAIIIHAIILFVFTITSFAGTITTVAGNGTSGYIGDEGEATSAQLASPYGVAVDDAGNIFIADSTNHRIRKVDTSGIITTVAGNGTLAIAVTKGRLPAHN